MVVAAPWWWCHRGCGSGGDGLKETFGRDLGAFVLSAAVFLFVDEGGDSPRGGAGGNGLGYGSSSGSLNRFSKSLYD